MFFKKKKHTKEEREEEIRQKMLQDFRNNYLNKEVILKNGLKGKVIGWYDTDWLGLLYSVVVKSGNKKYIIKLEDIIARELGNPQ